MFRRTLRLGRREAVLIEVVVVVPSGESTRGKLAFEFVEEVRYDARFVVDLLAMARLEKRPLPVDDDGGAVAWLLR